MEIWALFLKIHNFWRLGLPPLSLIDMLHWIGGGFGSY
jgi:hypothetical protein